MPGIDTIQSYLVSLGFDINSQQWNKFQAALKNSGKKVEEQTKGITKHFVGMSVGVVAALGAITAASVKLVESIGEQDLSYRKFALAMFISVEQAKKLKITMDAMGEHDLGQIAWIPELHERFKKLQDWQNRLLKLMPADFKATMDRVRNATTEWMKFKESMTYGVQLIGHHLFTLFEKMSGGLLKKLGIHSFQEALEKLNDYIAKHLDEWAEKISKYMMSVAKSILYFFEETWPKIKAAWEGIKEAFGDIYDALVKVKDVILYLLEKFGLYDKKTAGITETTRVLADVIGGLLIVKFLGLGWVISGVIGILGRLGSFFITGAFMTPGGLVILAILAIAAAVYLLYTNWDLVTKKTHEWGELIRKGQKERQEKREKEHSGSSRHVQIQPLFDQLPGFFGALRDALFSAGASISPAAYTPGTSWWGYGSLQGGYSPKARTGGDVSATPSVQSYAGTGSTVGPKYIVRQESGGDYGAENPRTHAYGKYQIMPANWGPWAQEAGLGWNAPRTPKNQELVYQFKMSQYMQKFGDDRLAAAAWYGGEGAARRLQSGKMSEQAFYKKQHGHEASFAEYIKGSTGRNWDLHAKGGGDHNYEDNSTVHIHVEGSTHDPEHLAQEISKALEKSREARIKKEYLHNSRAIREFQPTVI